MEDIFGYVLIAVIGIGVVTAICTPLCLLFNKVLKIETSFTRQLIFVFFIGVIVVIIWATILIGGVELGTQEHFLNLIPFKQIFNGYDMRFEKMIAQVLSNVIMFIPVGILFPIVFRKNRAIKNTMICCIGFSAFIEIVQYFIGRSADIDDLILNAVGGLLGYLIYKIIFRAFPKSKIW